MATTTQHFVGDTPVDSFPSEATQQIPDDELAKKEVKRLSKGEQKGPGAGKRAGAASRNPDGKRKFPLCGTLNASVMQTMIHMVEEAKAIHNQRQVRHIFINLKSIIDRVLQTLLSELCAYQETILFVLLGSGYCAVESASCESVACNNYYIHIVVFGHADSHVMM